MTEDSVRSHQQGSCTILTLNRPDKLNALDAEAHLLLWRRIDEAAADDDCRTIILTGAGRGFCAGQDLSKRVFDPASPPDLGASLEEHYNPLVRRLRELQKPVICAVNGVAAGAGANIALACDIVIASASARFIQSFSRLGLIPDSGGTYTLPRLVGSARARALMLLGQPVSAEQAAEWGMIWECVPDDLLMSRALEIANVLGSYPAGGMALTKAALAASETNSFEQQLDLERDTQREAGGSPEYAAAVQAFLAKRTVPK